MPENTSKLIRSRLTFDEIDGLRITIPARTQPPAPRLLQIPLTVVALIGSCWLACAILAFLWNRDLAAFKPPAWLFLVAGLASCFVVGWASQWWECRCSETIRIDGDDLALSSRGYFFLHGKEFPYRLSKVRNLRYAPSQDLGPSGSSSKRPSLAFNVDELTIRFGLGLSEEESRRLIRTIKDRYKILEDKDEPLPVDRL